MEPLKSERYHQLDSLRGLAALTVFFGHAVLMINYDNIFNLFHNTALHIFWDGAAAVVLFFLLSGFVLTLPYVKEQDKSIEYFPFLIRRIFRIYPAYIAALALSLILKIFLFNRAGISDFGSFVNQFWGWKTGDLTFSSLVRHVIMIGPNFERGEIDPIIWSLIVEMKISVIFPLFIFFTKKINKLWVGSVVLILSLVFGYLSGKYLINYFPTLTQDIFLYLPVFIFGSLLAKFHVLIIVRVKKLSRAQKLGLIVLGIILYSSRFSLHFIGISYNNYNYVVSLGVAIIIVFSLSSVTAKKLLTLKPVKFLGDISYSFYLFHFPIIMTVISIVYRKFHSVRLSFAISLFIGIIVSYLGYRFVEVPFQSVGRSLSKKAKTLVTSLNSSGRQVDQ
ncbi:MAG TPA: acyltransferase [Clostridia bacterium]